MKVLIVSVQSDYKFPLAEAVRKQIFAEAKKLLSEGKEVEVLIFTLYQQEKIIVDDIIFNIDLKKNLYKYILFFKKFDLIWFIGNIGIYSLLVSMFSINKKKQMTICDGGVFSLGNKKAKIKKLAKFFYILYDKFFIYTDYQKKCLLEISNNYNKKLIKTFPILDEKIDLSVKKYNNPTLLYMGHLSLFKGLDTVFFIFKKLKNDIPNLKLIIANNGLMGDEKVLNELNELKIMYPKDIIEKGKINPYEELKKAHLYIYLFKQPNGTFAFPLSLYESLLCNTPFLGPNIEGVKEFFCEEFLENPDDKEACYNKAKNLISLDCSEIIQKNIKNLKCKKDKLR